MKNKKVIIAAAIVATIGFVYGTLAFMNIHEESSGAKLKGAASKGFTCKKQAGLGSASGDVNGDGKITYIDVSLAQRIAASKNNTETNKAFTDCEKKRADMNSDGKVTTTDADEILSRIPIKVVATTTTKKASSNPTLYCVAKKGDSKSKKITSVKTNKEFYCYTDKKAEVILLATKSGITTGYPNNILTTKNNYWLKLKYNTAGTKTITARSGGKTTSIKISVTKSTTTTTKKKTTTKTTTKSNSTSKTTSVVVKVIDTFKKIFNIFK